MRYDGGKGQLYRQIINLIPPHRVYIETHLGGGAVLRYKRPAEINIGIDIDEKVVMDRKKDIELPGVVIINGDARSYLEHYQFQGDEFVYCDPPYLLETRRRGKMYRHEYTEQHHLDLLRVIKKLPCRIMISGYPHAIYDDNLSGWEKREYTVMTRAHTQATECLWTNYTEPRALHDYSFLGNTFREREKIKRKVHRWVNRLNSMNRLERAAILKAMCDEAAVTDKEGDV